MVGFAKPQPTLQNKSSAFPTACGPLAGRGFWGPAEAGSIPAMLTDLNGELGTWSAERKKKPRVLVFLRSEFRIPHSAFQQSLRPMAADLGFRSPADRFDSCTEICLPRPMAWSALGLRSPVAKVRFLLGVLIREWGSLESPPGRDPGDSWVQIPPP